MSRPAVLGVAFVVTLSAVLGAVAAVGIATTGQDSAAEPPEIENPQYLNETLPKDRTPGTAEVRMSADVAPQTIVIDPGIEPATRTAPRPSVPFAVRGSSADSLQRNLSPLVNTLVENGHNVRIYTPPSAQQTARQQASRRTDDQSLTPLGQELADADAFVTFRSEYEANELAEIRNFSRADGRTVVMTEPADSFTQPGAATLQASLNVTTKPGYVYNMGENDLNFQRIFAEPATDTVLTDGIERVVFPTATPVAVAGTPDSQLNPITGSRLSTSRAETTEPVMARSGDTVVIGDRNFLWPENAQRADNDVLIGNLADYLVLNDRTPADQPPTPPETSTPPTGADAKRPQPPSNSSPSEPEQSPTETPTNSSTMSATSRLR